MRGITITHTCNQGAHRRDQAGLALDTTVNQP